MPDKAVLKSLIESYKESGLVLALGAGVSKDCEMPTWFELLERLSVNYFKEKKKDGAAIFKGLVEYGYTLPAIAGILEHKFGSTKKFSEKIREELYTNFDYYPDGVDDRRQEFIDFVSSHNPTLSAIAALCAIPQDDSKKWFRPNPAIRAIVTTNWDAILQAYTKARYPTGVVAKGSEPRRILRTIERPSAGMKKGRICVYHIHGFLRFAKEDFRDPEREAPDLRVFTEQEFFNVFNQPNSLFNYTFLSLLREHSFLFIGMSLKDDNIRRLLHYSKMERELSYLKERRKAKKALRRSVRHFAILPKPKPDVKNKLELKAEVKKLAEVKRLTETSLKRLGTRVLWVDEPEQQVPELLSKLYESDGRKWKKVFSS